MSLRASRGLRTRRPALLLALVLVLPAPVAAVRTAWGDDPVVEGMTPRGLPRGEWVEVVFTGKDLGGVDGHWSSVALELELFEEATDDARRLRGRIRAPADAELGVEALRLTCGARLSEPLLFVVDDLRMVASGALEAGEDANVLSLPVALDGTVAEERSDRWKLRLARGDELSGEVLAQRLGSALDPVVAVRGPDGRIVRTIDDALIWGDDPRFAIVAPEDGEYVLEVRDVEHRGGAGYDYRLRLGDFPLVAVPYPLGVTAGSEVELRLLGPGAPSLPARAVALPGAARGTVSIEARREGGASSSWCRAVLSRFAEHVESESGGASEGHSAGALIGLPAAVNGRFLRDRERDVYRLDVPAAGRWRLRAHSRSLGSPAEVLLRLETPDGKSLGEGGAEGAGEADLTCKVDGSGEHRLVVEELSGGSGEGWAYRVEIERWAPGFELTVAKAVHRAEREKPLAIEVACARRGYDGPIELAIEGLGDGVEIVRSVIEAKKDKGELELRLPESFPENTWRAVRIRGRARIDDEDVEVEATPLPAFEERFPRRFFPPDHLLGPVFVSVR